MTGRGALALLAARRASLTLPRAILALPRAGLAALLLWWMLGSAMVSTALAQDSRAGDAAAHSGAGDAAAHSEARLPVDAWNPDLSAFLSHAPGTFEYSFGAAGWPDAVSRYGAEPERMELSFAGMPFTDLLTGRPLYEMTPEIMVGHLSEGTHGTAITPRAFRDPYPLTLMRYQAAGNAWQDVQVVHAQNRVFGADQAGGEGRAGGSGADSTRAALAPPLPGPAANPYGLHTLFGYSGAGARGEFDGSRLRRARQVIFRVGFTRPQFSLRLTDINTRHRVGAHGGVEPFTAEYASIFQRLGATVINEDDERQTLRNDLMLEGRAERSRHALDVTAFQTWQTFTFGDLGQLGTDPDTRRDRESRTGFAARVTRIGRAPGGQPRPTSGTSGAARRLSSVDSLSARVRAWRTGDIGHAELGGAAALRVRGLPLRVEAGLVRTGSGGVVRSAWHVAGGVMIGAGGRTAELKWQPVAVAPIDASGFLSPLEALSGRPPRTLTVRGNWTERRGAWSVTAVPWLTHSDRLWLRMPLADDSRRAAGVVLPEGGVSTGIAFVLGYRMHAERGVYAWAGPAWQEAHASTGGMETGSPERAGARAWERALPRLSLSGRAGLRTLLFLGDLDLDAFVRVRSWEAFGGRTLHTATGLLLPREGSDRDVPSSTILDFVAEGGVRGATLFLAYENALSGTNVVRGNLIVPDYPLPEQQIRFGVLWPIKN